MTFSISKINLDKINQEWLFQGKSGKYLTISIAERSEPDKYGNTVDINQMPPMEMKSSGVKPVQIGSGKSYERKGSNPRQAPDPAKEAPTLTPYTPPKEEDDVPF